MDTSLITTLATVPAVLALVTLFKDLGLSSRLAPVAAIALGVALQLFDLAVAGAGFTTPEVLGAVSTGLILGLSASGLYDGAKLISKRDVIEAKHASNEDPTLF